MGDDRIYTQADLVAAVSAVRAEADRLRAQRDELDDLLDDHISNMARDFSLWLNSTYPPNLDAETVHWRRVLKVAEEAGEVREAMGAWVHENPRKPAGSVEDVIKELADCVGAALGAIEHLTGHEGRSLEIATERVRFVCERVGVSALLDPSPAERTGHDLHTVAMSGLNAIERRYGLPETVDPEPDLRN